MLDALPPAVPTRPTGLRSRRGVAITAVTIASLGVGGLVAAGPGIFSPAADRTPPTLPDSASERAGVAVTMPASTSTTPGTTLATQEGSTLMIGTNLPSESEVGAIAAAPDDESVECVGDTHGDSVSEVARDDETTGDDEAAPGRGSLVREVAQSACGKPEQSRDRPSDTAPGRTGTSPADTAPGRTGTTPTDASKPSDTAPGRSGDTSNPSDTAPGRSVDQDTDSNGTPNPNGKASASGNPNPNGKANGKP
jgi:hypothetical protein